MRTSRATNAQKKSGCWRGLTKNDRSVSAHETRSLGAGASLGSRSRNAKASGTPPTRRMTARTRKPTGIVDTNCEAMTTPIRPPTKIPSDPRAENRPRRETGARSGTMALIGPLIML